jgi:hypothetical protein
MLPYQACAAAAAAAAAGACDLIAIIHDCYDYTMF